MKKSIFHIQSDWAPAGDQPEAIAALTQGVESGAPFQTLLGVTGSGKTFTMANVIANIGKPTLVIAHNKTLAAQLAQEYQTFFPDHAVHYFVSYYDFYQPEAYLPVTDTYIEKDAQINEEIDRLRHASTQALLTRRDTIIVASVSCIYGLGSPAEYEKKNLRLSVGTPMTRTELLHTLVSIFFERTNADLTSGSFRSLGNRVEVMPVSEKYMYSIDILAGKIGRIVKIDPVTQKILEEPQDIFLFPAKHFITNEDEKARALSDIREELALRLAELEKEGKFLEVERLKRRTTYDLAMIEEIGYCSGIENYSRHLSGKLPGEPAETLLSYFPHLPDGTPDFLTVIDESHVTVPQLRGMYAGDRSRKQTLVEFGFRLPSALDNRPLRFEEFLERVGPVVFTSATPSDYERDVSARIVEQVIRPTGLLDPVVEVRGVRAVLEAAYPGQIGDFIAETEAEVRRGGRVIATTLTKKMAEDLAVYLKEKGIRSEYLHSDIKTIDRIKILTSFRKGEFDCLVGVNLLREGLDLPEVSFIGILDADKEGFLRSETSLIQIIGRAARNVDGRVTLYADRITNSMKYALDETDRRRKIQTEYNVSHGITPETIRKTIHDITEHLESEHDKAVRVSLSLDEQVFAKDPAKLIRLKEKEMKQAVKALDFETAALLRDEIRALEAKRKQAL
ncbi:MAG: excinuclease subunit [Patescibacteria group bacterium]|nr:excinuclease subunit [Patescibacteria group bacterium]